MSTRNIIIATASLSLGAPVMVQSAPPPQRPTSTQILMQNNGGSLLQASPGDPTAKTPSYSMIAVPGPEPKVLRKHDLVNIIVQETSQFQATGTTDLKKNATLD